MSRSDTIKLITYRMFLNIKAMLVAFLKALPLGVLVGGIIYFLLERYTKYEKNKKIAMSLLSSYSMIMLQMAVLFRKWGSVYEIDLIPFNTQGGVRYIILYGIANILVFLPIGILFPIITKKMCCYKYILLIGFVFSFIIEALQLALKCGVCQTEDLILNTLGAGLGYTIYKNREAILNKLKHKETKSE